jgi:hypothetical protein
MGIGAGREMIKKRKTLPESPGKVAHSASHVKAIKQTQIPKPFQNHNYNIKTQPTLSVDGVGAREGASVL